MSFYYIPRLHPTRSDVVHPMARARNKLLRIAFCSSKLATLATARRPDRPVVLASSYTEYHELYGSFLKPLSNFCFRRLFPTPQCPLTSRTILRFRNHSAYDVTVLVLERATGFFVHGRRTPNPHRRRNNQERLPIGPKPVSCSSENKKLGHNLADFVNPNNFAPALARRGFPPIMRTSVWSAQGPGHGREVEAIQVLLFFFGLSDAPLRCSRTSDSTSCQPGSAFFRALVLRSLG